ncbi:MAG TPA: N-acetylmuramoyl-L-alanine amidase [Steroidobacteraceae bacterium]|nr:N-acetylmuramoyl-L-alanine amidase [Steroidobacteraceae bacterium]
MRYAASPRARIAWGLIAPLVLCAAAGRAAEVTDVRLTASADGARLELGLTAAVTSRVFTLDQPARVVVDLRPASLDRRRVPLPAAAGAVRSVRAGPRANGGLRLVLEVDRALAVRALPPAEDGARRLVVELGAPEAPRVAAARAPAAAERVAPPSHGLLIAVDAGHGGIDPGATGHDGTHEKDVTLAIARALAQRINAEPGMHAILTRPNDAFVPLKERVERAREARADLFVSVHADAIADRNVAGSSVYVLSARGASSEAAKRLADRENAADLVGGVSLDDKDPVIASVLLDLSQSAAMSASMAAAEKVLGELTEVGAVRKGRVQQAGFVVLKAPDIPSLLIETAYITNPSDERRLRDARYQGRLADAILAGVRAYFRDNPPPGTRLAALATAAAAPAAPADAGGGAAPRGLRR